MSAAPAADQGRVRTLRQPVLVLWCTVLAGFAAVLVVTGAGMDVSKGHVPLGDRLVPGSPGPDCGEEATYDLSGGFSRLHGRIAAGPVTVRFATGDGRVLADIEDAGRGADVEVPLVGVQSLVVTVGPCSGAPVLEDALLMA